jgi:vitamin B12 transporter
MRTSLQGRQALACAAFAAASFAPAALHAADRIAGVVVDQSGQRLPRAFVRAIDGAGTETSSAIADERGTFELAVADSNGCRVEVVLTGFSPASTPCGAAARIVLTVAPVRESVVVSATRTAAPADQVGASVTTFTAEDLERRRTALASDLLRSTPGAMLIRSGAPGAVTSLFVRGGESTYNKVLIDGIPINEPGGTFFFNNLTTDNLERIEIVRGAQSALFGSDAMASVVQLFTRRADASGAAHGNVDVEAGSYHTLRAAASAAGRAGRLEYSVGAARIDTRNRVPNSDFDNTTLSGSVATAVAGNATLRVVTRAELGRNGAPGQTAFGRPDLDAFATRHDGLAGVVFDQQLTAAIRQQASYSLAASNQGSTNLVADPPYVARFDGRVAPFQTSDFLYDSRTELRRHHGSYQADVRLANGAASGSQLLTVLADWDGERATLLDRRAGTSSEPSRDNIGVSVQHQAIWRRIVATASGRVEHNASFGTAAVPRGAVVIVLREGQQPLGATRVHVSGGAGIKEPTLLQSFSPSPFFRGNPDLEPERSRSVEAGVDQRFAGDRVRVQATWFDNRFRNLISTRTTNPQTFEAQYFNIGLTRARGLELSGEAAPLAFLRVRAGYTLLDSKILESTSPSSAVLRAGQPLFRRPRHSGFVDASWSQGRVSANLSGVFTGQFVDSDFSSFTPPLLVNPGYTTWDARIAYKATRLLTALVSIDNVADADYMEPLGYQALGRAVRAGLRVGF